jgi:hypothetical protein
MFKTLSGLTNNAFWRVSADTKTCGSPQNCRLLAGYVSLLAPEGKLTGGYFNIFLNKSQ